MALMSDNRGRKRRSRTNFAKHPSGSMTLKIFPATPTSCPPGILVPLAEEASTDSSARITVRMGHSYPQRHGSKSAPEDQRRPPSPEVAGDCSDTMLRHELP